MGGHGGIKAALAKVDVRARGIGPGVHGLRLGLGLVPHVEPYAREIRPQPPAHGGLDRLGPAAGHRGGQPVGLGLGCGDLGLRALLHMVQHIERRAVGHSLGQVGPGSLTWCGIGLPGPLLVCISTHKEPPFQLEKFGQ